VSAPDVKRPVLVRLVGGPCHGMHLELGKFMDDIRVNVEGTPMVATEFAEDPYPTKPFWHQVETYRYHREQGVWVWVPPGPPKP
jgi:hypothetical protein